VMLWKSQMTKSPKAINNAFEKIPKGGGSTSGSAAAVSVDGPTGWISSVAVVSAAVEAAVAEERAGSRNQRSFSRNFTEISATVTETDVATNAVPMMAVGRMAPAAASIAI